MRSSFSGFPIDSCGRVRSRDWNLCDGSGNFNPAARVCGFGPTPPTGPFHQVWLQKFGMWYRQRMPPRVSRQKDRMPPLSVSGSGCYTRHCSRANAKFCGDRTWFSALIVISPAKYWGWFRPQTKKVINLKTALIGCQITRHGFWGLNQWCRWRWSRWLLSANGGVVYCCPCQWNFPLISEQWYNNCVYIRGTTDLVQATRLIVHICPRLEDF